MQVQSGVKEGKKILLANTFIIIVEVHFWNIREFTRKTNCNIHRTKSTDCLQNCDWYHTSKQKGLGDTTCPTLLILMQIQITSICSKTLQFKKGLASLLILSAIIIKINACLFKKIKDKTNEFLITSLCFLGCGAWICKYCGNISIVISHWFLWVSYITGLCLQILDKTGK